MEINTGVIRKKKSINQWLCWIQYTNDIGTVQMIPVTGGSKQQCKERVQEMVTKIKQEYHVEDNK